MCVKIVGSKNQLSLLSPMGSWNLYGADGYDPWKRVMVNPLPVSSSLKFLFRRLLPGSVTYKRLMMEVHSIFLSNELHSQLIRTVGHKLHVKHVSSLSYAARIYPVPATFFMSSVHLSAGRNTRLPWCGCQSWISLFHRPQFSCKLDRATAIAAYRFCDLCQLL